MVNIQQCTSDVVRACEINDVALLFKCIAIGGPQCFQSGCGAYPLHVAARRDSSACCMLLLVSGCDVLERDASDLTASEVASKAGHMDLSTFLLEREEHHLAAMKSRRNSNASRTSDASQENSHDNTTVDLGNSDSNSCSIPTGSANLNHEFEDMEMQLSMKEMVSKALSSSDEDMEGFDKDELESKSSRNTTTEDATVSE